MPRADGARSAELGLIAAFIREHHPAIQTGRVANAFREQCELTRGVADRLDWPRYVIAVQQLLATLGDPHTTLYPLPKDGEFDLRIPVLTRPLGSGVYVAAAAPPYASLVGGRLLAINDWPIAAVGSAIAAIWPHRNLAWVERWLPIVLRRPGYLAGLGLLSSAARVSLRVALPGGGETSRVISATNSERDSAGRSDWIWATGHSIPYPGEVGGLRVDRLLAQRSVVGGFGESADTEDLTVEAFAEELRRTVEAERPERVVLDLRDNGGGDNELNHFVERAVAAIAERQGPRLFALIGPATFSAGMNFATWLERNTDALFVGEPTGGSPNHYGDVVVHTAASGLSVICSTRLWQDSDLEDDRPWIMPDIAVRPDTLAELECGDHPLAAALADRTHRYRASEPRWQRPSQAADWHPSWRPGATSLPSATSGPLELRR